MHRVWNELRRYGRGDLLAGFVVFLVALPLSLGISMASGFPPFAGLLAAAVGGLVVSRLSGSHVTINGPAAGLIVIVLSGVETLGGGDAWLGYRLTLGAIVIAGAVLLVSGFLRGGALSEFFPISAVHGMLSAIGITIISKQIHVALGVGPSGKTPLALLAEIPGSLMQLNPEITLIAFLSMLLLVGLPLLPHPFAKRFPAPMAVVLLSIGLARYFDLDHQHKYLFLSSHEYAVGPRFLVSLPENLLAGVTLPLWTALRKTEFWTLVLTLSIVQGLETLLSASAVDAFDPLKRKSDLNRDLRAVGLGSMLSGMLGGLPMIAEIVRSRANVMNGARTSWSNFFHGAFILLFVSAFPTLIHQIPLSALACILIVTGYRLASPSQFSHVWKVGSDQFAVFMTTLLVTLGTDLLMGVGAGLVVELLLVGWKSRSVTDLVRSPIEVIEQGKTSAEIRFTGVVTFLNYRILRKALDSMSKAKRVVLNFESCRGLDHTVIDRLEHWVDDAEAAGQIIERRGWDALEPNSAHERASRWSA